MVHQVTFPAPIRGLEVYHEDLLPQKDLLWLNTKPGRTPPKSSDCIPALHIRGNKNGKPADFTVIYSHGNAEDISQEQFFARELARSTGCDFLLYEYPGYSLSRFTSENGKNKVKPSETKIKVAIEAAYRYLVNDCALDPSKIIIYGRSIGSGPSLHLASRQQIKFTSEESSPQNVAGVFLVSPFLSTVRALLGHKTAISCFCFDKFPNHRNIHNVSAHVAIMHARDDDIVRFSNGVDLYENFVHKEFEPMWMDYGGHNYIRGSTILSYLEDFKQFLLEKRALRINDAKNGITKRQIPRKPQNQAKSTNTPPTVETSAVTTQTQFLPTKVPQPMLRDFSPETGITTQIGSDGEPVLIRRPLTKEQRRLQRLEALRKRMSL